MVSWAGLCYRIIILYISTFSLKSPFLHSCWFLRLRKDAHTPPPSTSNTPPLARKAGAAIVWPVLALFHLNIRLPAFHSSSNHTLAPLTHTHTHTLALTRTQKETSCSLCQPIKSHLCLDGVRKLLQNHNWFSLNVHVSENTAVRNVCLFKKWKDGALVNIFN